MLHTLARLYPSAHHAVVAAHHFFALASLRLGEWDVAEQQFRVALSVRRSTLGDKHPMASSSRICSGVYFKHTDTTSYINTQATTHSLTPYREQKPHGCSSPCKKHLQMMKS